MIQYLIIIILIIGFIYLSNKDNFWNQLPVSNNKIINYGYITNNFSTKELLGNLFIEVEKQKYSAELIDKPLKQSNFKKN